MKSPSTAFVLKLVAAIVMLGLLFAVVDTAELWNALSQLTILGFAYLMFISVVLIYCSALKWKIFLEAFGHNIPVLRLFNLYIVGYFINTFIPSYVGGDAVRSWYVGKRVGQHQALTATILERYTGITAMISLAVVFVWVVQGVTWQIKSAVMLVALGIGVITALALWPKTFSWLNRFSQLKKVLSSVKKIQDGFHLARKQRGLFVKTMGLSYVYHTITVLNTVAAAYAVGWDNPPVSELFVVVPLILLVGSIPISPSGLGIQEGAFVFFLHGLGATTAQALGLALVLRAKSYVLALWGWGIWLGVKGSGGNEAAPESGRGAQTRGVKIH